VLFRSTIDDDRRFFIAPDVVQSRDYIGPFDGVLIGTGDREDPNGDDVDHFFYLIKDRNVPSGIPPSTTLEHDDMADLTDNCLQTQSCSSPPDLSNGWRIALGEDDGEKSLASPVTAGGRVFFSTFAPTASGSSCSLTEGVGRLYVVSLVDATAVHNFDTTNDVGGSGAGGIVYERVDILGSGGIPVEVVPLGNGELLVQGQEAGQNIMQGSANVSLKTYWHEIFQ
jgi:type IV pilus assembly protein PilY1